MPILAKPVVLWVAAAYFVVVFAIGIWAAFATRTPRDFFIAGQRLGTLVAGLATMTAAFSGFVFLGGPGLTYRMGLSSLFIVVPLGVTSGMLCWVLAPRLRRLAGLREVFTIPDAVLARFESRTVAALAAVAVLVGTVGYLGAQIQALGVLLEAMTGSRELLGAWSLPVAMAVGVVAVLAYAVAGGMLAGVYTDLAQGVLMVGAALAVFVHAVRAGGGLEAMTRRIAAAEEFGPSFLDPLGNVPVLTALGFFFVFSVGTLGQPHMAHKFYMVRDLDRLRWLPVVLGGSQALCVLLWLGIGLAVPALVAGGGLEPVARPDDAAPVFLLRHVPDPLAGIVLAGVLAAIMSTADSFVNIAAATLVRDLPRALGLRVRRELRWGRFAVVAVAVVGALGAWLYGDLIALLGTFAFGTLAAALAPVLAVGLCWRRVSALAAGVSITTGMLCNLGLETLARQTAVAWLPRTLLRPGMLPAAAALAASFLALFLVTWLDRRRRPPLAPEIASVIDG